MQNPLPAEEHIEKTTYKKSNVVKPKHIELVVNK